MIERQRLSLCLLLGKRRQRKRLLSRRFRFLQMADEMVPALHDLHAQKTRHQVRLTSHGETAELAQTTRPTVGCELSGK